jgi:hypothetical protein
MVLTGEARVQLADVVGGDEQDRQLGAPVNLLDGEHVASKSCKPRLVDGELLLVG